MTMFVNIVGPVLILGIWCFAFIDAVITLQAQSLTNAAAIGTSFLRGGGGGEPRNSNFKPRTSQPKNLAVSAQMSGLSSPAKLDSHTMLHPVESLERAFEESVEIERNQRPQFNPKLLSVAEINARVRNPPVEGEGLPMEQLLALKAQGAVKSFRSYMAMCNTFDEYLNSIVENEELMSKMETEANNYASKAQQYFGEKSDFEEFKFHYALFNAPRFGVQPTKEQAMSVLFITYYSYWLTISFRFCTLFYNVVTPNPDEETANRISACKELYPHMHWFGNMFYDQRLHDIKKVFSPETADDRITGDTILERFSDVFTASHTANKLELVNLEFIMDQKYFEGAGRDLIARKPHPDIRNYSERLVDEEGMEFGTIFPTDDVSQLVSNVLAYRDEAEKREQIFTTIHQFILNHTPWEMVEVDDYFVRLILGTPLPESDQNLHAVTPNYNSVMARWAVLPEYMEIKNMKAKDKRPIYGGVGNKIYRSKAVGIFRHMIEVAIKAKVAGFPGFPDISVFRGEPSFKLTEPVSSRSLSDYVISVKNPMTGA